MQPRTAPPRDNLTATQVAALIESDHLSVDYGCELLDDADALITDISTDVAGGTVERNNYRTVHATCRLRVSRELQWGWQRLRPYMTLTDAYGVTARFNLGVFLVGTPARVAGETPHTFDVEGYDKLVVLNTPYGATYAAAAGAAVLDLVDALIRDGGEDKIRLDRTSSAVTLPSARVWEIDEASTRLRIINDLLALIGYRALWVDHDGYYRSEPYASPATQPVEWTYDAQHTKTIVGRERVEEADFFAAPNRWVFVRDDPALTLPAEGDGLYTVVNQSDGPTSVDERRRVITRVERLAAASQTALKTQGDRIVENDKRVLRHLELTTGPNPLHGHFDVVQVRDSELGVDHPHLSQSWTLPLDGGDMRHRLRRI